MSTRIDTGPQPKTPCPWCGNIGYLGVAQEDDGVWWGCYCSSCNARGPSELSQEKAVATWDQQFPRLRKVGTLYANISHNDAGYRAIITHRLVLDTPNALAIEDDELPVYYIKPTKEAT